MRPKYSVGEKLWTVSADHGKFAIVQCTVESIDLRGEAPHYKMKKGCPFWKREEELSKDTKVIEEIYNVRREKAAKIKAEQKLISDYWEPLSEKAEGIEDGIYDLTDIEFIQLDAEEPDIKTIDAVKEFVGKYPDFLIAHAYETYDAFLIARKPSKITTSIGSGFNYGSTNIITDCPRTILILAEND